MREIESSYISTIPEIELYKDTLGKKRWVLKFDDEKALEQIDAVFREEPARRVETYLMF